jgi:glycosyltransferase involved in cell wall biosynthesis
MRLALVKYSAIARHGGTRQLFCLARELLAMGIDTEIVLHDYAPDLAFPELAAGLPIRWRRRMDRDRRIGFVHRVAIHEAESRALASLVPRSATVINVHEWMGLRGAVRARAARPLVWMCNDPSWWHLLAIADGSPKALGGRALTAIDRSLHLRHVDRTLVLSEQARRVMERATARRVFVIRSGVDTDWAPGVPGPRAARAALGLDDRPTILAVGVLIPRRRIEDLLDALEVLRRPDVQVIIVGAADVDPGYAAAVRRRAADRSLRASFVTEPVTDERLRLYYAACDAFVFPNVDQTWGLAVTEAMAAGRPCIVSRGAGVHEILTDGVDAILVDPLRPDRLAAALRRLLDDPLEGARIGKAGERRVQALSWRAYAEAMLGHFEVAAAGHAGDRD